MNNGNRALFIAFFGNESSKKAGETINRGRGEPLRRWVLKEFWGRNLIYIYTQLNNHPQVTPAKIALKSETANAAISILPIFIIRPLLNVRDALRALLYAYAHYDQQILL
jgi:hypothetical protein